MNAHMDDTRSHRIDNASAKETIPSAMADPKLPHISRGLLPIESTMKKLAAMPKSCIHRWYGDDSDAER